MLPGIKELDECCSTSYKSFKIQSMNSDDMDDKELNKDTKDDDFNSQIQGNIEQNPNLDSIKLFPTIEEEIESLIKWQ